MHSPWYPQKLCPILNCNPCGKAKGPKEKDQSTLPKSGLKLDRSLQFSECQPPPHL